MFRLYSFMALVSPIRCSSPFSFTLAFLLTRDHPTCRQYFCILQEYDKNRFRQHCSLAKVIIPSDANSCNLSHSATLRSLSNDSTRVLSQRNLHISKIEEAGRSNWCRQSGYYLQSHVENTFSRFKRIIGGRLRSKHDESQKREALIGCAILNKMLEIGRPVSYQFC